MIADNSSTDMRTVNFHERGVTEGSKSLGEEKKNESSDSIETTADSGSMRAVNAQERDKNASDMDSDSVSDMESDSGSDSIRNNLASKKSSSSLSSLIEMNSSESSDCESSIEPPPSLRSSFGETESMIGSDDVEAPLAPTESKFPWPEKSCLTRSWTFSYMNRILQKGSNQKKKDPSLRLVQDDLYSVPFHMKSSSLSLEFRTLYAAFLREDDLSLRHRDPLRPFLKSLWGIASRTFVPSGWLHLVVIFSRIASPLLIRQILILLETFPNESIFRQGLPWVVSLFLIQILRTLAQHHSEQLTFAAGISVRSAIINELYSHTISLSPDTKTSLRSGEVINLVAVDTEKLFEVLQEGHLLWACPLMILLVTVILFLIIGPSALVGVVVMSSFVPILKRIVSRMSRWRRERVTLSDERINSTSALLSGIKVVKLNFYEKFFFDKIATLRTLEMSFLRKELCVISITVVMTLASPILASGVTFTLYVMVNDKANLLTASTVFSVLMLYNAIKFPINWTGKLVQKIAPAKLAAGRIAHFLSREPPREPIPEGECKHDPIRPSLVLENANFDIGVTSPKLSHMEGSHSTEIIAPPSSSFSLTDVQLTLRPNQTLAVAGPIGSGKSSLVNVLIGELPPRNTVGTTMRTVGKVRVAPQIPFLLNATLRENILFGEAMEENRYKSVLEACCLRIDLANLPDGDSTLVGDRGVTLSGGQKQRVSVARTVYAKSSIAIFDDPLSALDADTSQRMFGNLFAKERPAKFAELLKDSAVVLVTHAVEMLHHFDQILVLDRGRTVFLGGWDELTRYRIPRVVKDEEGEDDGYCGKGGKVSMDHKYGVLEAIQKAALKQDFVPPSSTAGRRGNYLSDSASSGKSTSSNSSAQDAVLSKPAFYRRVATNQARNEERREQGRISFKTWYLWFQSAGGIGFIIVLTSFLVLDRGAHVATEWWLAFWSEGATEPNELFSMITFDPQTDGRSAQLQYISVYLFLLLLSFTGRWLSSHWMVSGGFRCTESLFTSMLTGVLHAPMSYFDSTPVGRILTRFTHDVEIVDMALTRNMLLTTIAISWFVAAICVMVVILPTIILAIVPIVIVYGMMQAFYRRSAADLQRLSAVSRSPIQTAIAEGLEGGVVVRVFEKTPFFLRKFQGLVDTNSAAMFNYISAHRWLAIRIEMLGSIVSLCACLIVIGFQQSLGLYPGLVAVLINWSIGFTTILGFLVQEIANTESSIVSVERIHDMAKNTPQELAFLTPDHLKPDSAWPQRGFLEFRNVSVRYRPGLPLALRGLTFKIEPRKRCGVVGRTGSGKSTLTAALFRLVEIESGCIRLDDVDLSKLGLEDVRGRPNGMSIIPQDPVLFSGSLRECVDPFRLSTDEAIMEALVSVRLASQNSGTGLLDDLVEDGGANFSVGERQLLCLARAMLARSKVLVMDEATASVDMQTDVFIQNMLRTRFKDTTLITIAHRLITIMDYDKVLVMEDGRAVEFGSPWELLEEDGAFSDLVESTGEENAAVLRAIAWHNPA